MADAKQTTKKLAQRIDLNYFKQPHPFRRWRFWLSVIAPIAAVLWIGSYEIAGNDRVYSAGEMSASHRVLGTKCGACHVKVVGGFSAKASDEACLSCHDGPIHHANQTFTPHCSSCHKEHLGRVQLAATSNASCAQCHSNLQTNGAATKFVRDITTFNGGHPEFAALRPGASDPGTIKLNHAIHMKRNLLGPHGPVQLDCDDCHQPAISSAVLHFGSAHQQSAAPPAMQKSDLPLLVAQQAYMAPATYARHCADCHGLQFDKRFTEGVPHDTPEVIHAFLAQRFQTYIASHPSELREASPMEGLPQKARPAQVRILTPSQWAAEHVDEAEQLLWRKTCKQCHTLSFSAGDGLPAVAKSNITTRWFPHADFNHEKHQMLRCVECHPGGLASQETADILIPDIQTCQQCHNTSSNSAESRCFECHTYHDWTKINEVKGRTTLPSLRGGQ